MFLDPAANLRLCLGPAPAAFLEAGHELPVVDGMMSKGGWLDSGHLAVGEAGGNQVGVGDGRFLHKRTIGDVSPIGKGLHPIRNGGRFGGQIPTMPRKKQTLAVDRVEPLSTNIERMMAEHDPPLNTRSLALRIPGNTNEWLVRDILNGKSKKPQHDTIEKIAKAGGRSVEWLTGNGSATHDLLRAESTDLSEEETRATLAYIRTLKAGRSAA